MIPTISLITALHTKNTLFPSFSLPTHTHTHETMRACQRYDRSTRSRDEYGWNRLSKRADAMPAGKSAANTSAAAGVKPAYNALNAHCASSGAVVSAGEKNPVAFLY